MDLLTIVLQLLFGWLVRKWPVLASWPSKLIPIFNTILAILTQLLGGSLAHADSLGVSVLPQAHHGHPGWWALWAFLQPVIINTLMSTGIFSAAKNGREYFTSTDAQKRAATKVKT